MHRFQFLLPVVCGLYCLIQGFLLLASADELIRLFGVSMLAWVPACAYFAWRACATTPPKPAPARRAVLVMPAFEELESERLAA
jgi:hypothetical protein